MGLGGVIKHISPALYKKIVAVLDHKRYLRNKRWAMGGHPEYIIRDMYKNVFGREPDLDAPITFNEKLQWLKLYWYDERATICSNKHLVRSYVEQKGLGDLLIPQYGVYNSPKEIDFTSLPDKFVLKPSHDSGHVILCTDKTAFDQIGAVKKLEKWLNVDYEFMSGEWPYSGLKYIVCEKFLEDKKAGELLDYKFFCFSGEPYLCFFCSDRKNHVKSDFYDMNWVKQDFRWYYEPSGRVFEKPETFELMKKYAQILSEGFPFVRVDFYEVEGKVYFGELTFFHGGGLGWFKPDEIDRQLGEQLILPQKSNPLPWDIVLGRQQKGYNHVC